MLSGRFFKAFVFAVCVWGSWWTGMAMSDWKALQAPDLEAPQTAAVLKFAGQAGVGTPALWAMYQSHRYYGRDNTRVESVYGSARIPSRGGSKFKMGMACVWKKWMGRLASAIRSVSSARQSRAPLKGKATTDQSRISWTTRSPWIDSSMLIARVKCQRGS